ncbi:hypothetical protein B0H11DRAFT_2194810 [Mycena galericulata]|nr:hypothetical protein B0H11DRAFT_2194810 [Mycena galericulata]
MSSGGIEPPTLPTDTGNTYPEGAPRSPGGFEPPTLSSHTERNSYAEGVFGQLPFTPYTNIGVYRRAAETGPNKYSLATRHLTCANAHHPSLTQGLTPAMTYYDGLTIQFTLARGRKLSWMNELRKDLYPGQIPVHVTIFPVFSTDEDEYSALFERLEEVAALFEPWVLGECGTDQCNDWVAIRLWEEDGEGDAFVEEPHITVYRGPKSGAYIPYFDEWMGTAGIRRRLERLVDEYAAEHGGNGLSVRVTGLQLLHDGEVVGSFKFSG